MKKIAVAVLLLLGVYLIVRAVIEPFTIDFGDPDTYERDWGGPGLAGVLLVHMVPGLVSAVLIAWYWRRRRNAVRAGA